MQILVTGASGYIGAALVPRLSTAGHSVRGYGRSAARITTPVDDVVEGDAIAGTGLERALDGVEVAYFLIHSMEGPGNGFADLERQAAEHFAAAAAAAGVRRIVYLGGLVPDDGHISRHLASRLAVEELLLAAAPESIAFRASIVIGARSRSFRFLVRLVERMPVLALPAWRDNRTAPVDGRDMLDFLTRAATVPTALSGRSWDIGGPDVMSYGELVERIADAMLVRPSACACTRSTLRSSARCASGSATRS
jgi:uncharacterized protein YbjT (DUF2867 family)